MCCDRLYALFESPVSSRLRCQNVYIRVCGTSRLSGCKLPRKICLSFFFPVLYLTQALSASIDCLEGGYCPTGSVAPALCPKGTYRDTTGAESVDDCTRCAGGKFCAEEGLTNVTGTCAAGYFCKSGSPSMTPEKANSDKRAFLFARYLSDKSPEGSATILLLLLQDPDGQYGPCPVGQYCREGTEDPVDCPTGTYAPVEGNTDVTECMQCSGGRPMSQTDLFDQDVCCDKQKSALLDQLICVECLNIHAAEASRKRIACPVPVASTVATKGLLVPQVPVRPATIVLLALTHESHQQHAGQASTVHSDPPHRLRVQRTITAILNSQRNLLVPVHQDSSAYNVALLQRRQQQSPAMLAQKECRGTRALLGIIVLRVSTVSSTERPMRAACIIAAFCLLTRRTLNTYV
ncbi:UNVERIFIED_CONTAM: hypothetical protein H355_008660 [Colinus virginianus]|nr:hypothetical protein H355_008660 [Colinus virginianus]